MMSTMSAPPTNPAATGRQQRAWVPAAAALVWLGLWYFTPGLLSNGVGSRLAEAVTVSVLDTFDVGVLIECAVATALIAVLLLTHRRYNRVLFARSRLMWLYALPAVLAIALPFHYSLESHVGVYVLWWTVSVFWQDYLTFGLLQRYLRERLPAWATITGVAVMFWLGHAVFLPDRFGPTNLGPSLAMLALGALFAVLRAKLGTLHLLLALHLSFYLLLA